MRHLHGLPVTPPLASIAGERAVFSFRDMDHRGFPWRYEPAWDGAGAPAVNGAIRALLEAMYDPATTGGIHWAQGDLVILDNHRWFHGRTATDQPPHDRPRHLEKVTIAAAAAGQGP